MAFQGTAGRDGRRASRKGGSMPVTIPKLLQWKREGRRWAMLTCYDYPTARVLDEAGIPVLLVGDSLGNVVLGYPNTLPVSMEEMLHHTRAVARGVRNALVIGDMPFGSYQTSQEEAVRNAAAFLKAGANAVKLEGPFPDLVQALVARGIPVMGHLGLTPQFVNVFGGYRVQARTPQEAERLLSEAKELEAAGAFALVLEGIPSDVAARATASLSIPTVGIGAGPHCDAQVLVLHDMLGLTPGPRPKFVKVFADLAGEITRAVRAYAAEVEEGTFPAPEHEYTA
jgi:3-methyl-2-oxobutanoate hydroxymethyltransferase